MNGLWHYRVGVELDGAGPHGISTDGQIMGTKYVPRTFDLLLSRASQPRPTHFFVCFQPDSHVRWIRGVRQVLRV